MKSYQEIPKYPFKDMPKYSYVSYDLSEYNNVRNAAWNHGQQSGRMFIPQKINGKTYVFADVYDIEKAFPYRPENKSKKK